MHSVAGTPAHHGVLFLDELPELPRNVLELPRHSFEDGAVTLARSQLTLSFPPAFMLVAALNPCPCRYCGNEAEARVPGAAKRDPKSSFTRWTLRVRERDWKPSSPDGSL